MARLPASSAESLPTNNQAPSVLFLKAAKLDLENLQKLATSTLKPYIFHIVKKQDDADF
jgi:hypothetical protein